MHPAQGIKQALTLGTVSDVCLFFRGEANARLLAAKNACGGLCCRLLNSNLLGTAYLLSSLPQQMTAGGFHHAKLHHGLGTSLEGICKSFLTVYHLGKFLGGVHRFTFHQIAANLGAYLGNTAQRLTQGLHCTACKSECSTSGQSLCRGAYDLSWTELPVTHLPCGLRRCIIAAHRYRTADNVLHDMPTMLLAAPSLSPLAVSFLICRSARLLATFPPTLP